MTFSIKYIQLIFHYLFIYFFFCLFWKRRVTYRHLLRQNREKNLLPYKVIRSENMTYIHIAYIVSVCCTLLQELLCSKFNQK